jgi:hypothetical protein
MTYSDILQRVRVRLTVWRLRLRSRKIAATFPGGGVVVLSVDENYVITDHGPALGFVLTKGGDVLPVTAEGIYDEDDTAVLLHPTGVVVWPCSDSWPSLALFEKEMKERAEADLAVLRDMVKRTRGIKLVEEEET